ncbi:MAG: isoprenyl transferase [Clostridia bacterium]|nr:isoprenyl transferase [Clostridia bacterium]
MDIPSRMPEHIAIICDGNGRWAQERGLPRTSGHKEGVARVKELVRLASGLGIEALTFYAFSTENWKRPKEEVSVLMALLVEVLNREIAELHKNNVKLRIIGKKDGLSDTIRNKISEAEKLTENNTGLRLNIAFNYGGRDEIVRSFKKIAEKIKSTELSVEDIDEKLISDNLDTSGIPDPDFIIRTSGEQRLSNFLLYQSAYSELYFPQVYFPDFGKDQFEIALKEYSNRNRRYGKL